MLTTDTRHTVLYFQHQSPFCRKVRVYVREFGLHNNVIEIEQITSPVIQNDDVNHLNPLGKVPVLRDNDKVIIDSPLICDYLHQVSNKPKSLSESYFEVLADGICHAGILFKQERERSASNSDTRSFQQGQINKINRALDYVEQSPDFFESKIQIGQISIAVALDWLKFANIDSELKKYEQLNNWFRSFEARHSMQNTKFRGETDDGFVFDGIMKKASKQFIY